MYKFLPFGFKKLPVLLNSTMISFERSPSTVLAGETFRSRLPLWNWKNTELFSFLLSADGCVTILGSSFLNWFKGTKSMLGYHPLWRTAVVAYWSDCPGTSVLDGVSHFLASGSSWVAVWYQVCSSRLLLILRGCLHLFFIKPTLVLFLTTKNLDDCISVWLLQMDSAFIYHYSGKNIHEICTSISYFWLLN